MREIKFRGRRLDNGEWVYGCLTLYSNHISYIIVDLIEGKVYKVSTETVGQYIGFEDAHGVEIYEGDILDEVTKSVEVKHVVTLDASSINFIFDQFGYEDFRKLIKERQLEVIGNIYENPELLEG